MKRQSWLIWAWWRLCRLFGLWDERPRPWHYLALAAFLTAVSAFLASGLGLLIGLAASLIRLAIC
jgi:hypothetical protein